MSTWNIDRVCEFSSTNQEEFPMRLKPVMLLLPLLLAACGSTEKKTVIVNPPPGRTVVVEPDGDVSVSRDEYRGR
jgi:hypothetical protein